MRTSLLLLLGLVLAAHAQVLYDPDSPQSFLFTDKRALKVGDILTVVISERASASQRARAQDERTTESGWGPNTGLLDFLDSFSIVSEQSFVGEGSHLRHGTLTATLTVQVTEVAEGGNYKVEGQQIVVVDGEEQTLKLSGLVRAWDVGPNNTVLSNKIAQAKIEFEGKGRMTKRKRRTPFLQRLFGWLF